MKSRWILTAIFMVTAEPALAESTPRALREMSTDRPDQTESPYSVDAGHLQVESDVGSYAVTHEAGITTHETHVWNMNIRLGLTNRIDAQVVLLPLVLVSSQPLTRTATRREGFGDTALRLKVNLFGNDEGDVAVGLLPFVTLPTASAKPLGAAKTEWGLAVPAGFALPADFALGVMPQVDLVGGSSGGYVAEFTQTLTISHDIVGSLGAFTEVVSTVSFEGGTRASFELHGGLGYAATPDVLIDAGVFGTVLGSGEDLRMFLGLTVRR